jgi:hypothetical protein
MANTASKRLDISALSNQVPPSLEVLNALGSDPAPRERWDKMVDAIIDFYGHHPGMEAYRADQVIHRLFLNPFYMARCTQWIADRVEERRAAGEDL